MGGYTYRISNPTETINQIAVPIASKKATGKIVT